MALRASSQRGHTPIEDVHTIACRHCIVILQNIDKGNIPCFSGEVAVTWYKSVTCTEAGRLGSPHVGLILRRPNISSNDHVCCDGEHHIRAFCLVLSACPTTLCGID